MYVCRGVWLYIHMYVSGIYVYNYVTAILLEERLLYKSHLGKTEDVRDLETCTEI